MIKIYNEIEEYLWQIHEKDQTFIFNLSKDETCICVLFYYEHIKIYVYENSFYIRITYINKLNSQTQFEQIGKVLTDFTKKENFYEKEVVYEKFNIQFLHNFILIDLQRIIIANSHLTNLLINFDTKRKNYISDSAISQLAENYMPKAHKNQFPFALNSIWIENFYGIRKLQLFDIPLNTQWIFLTGQNGFGKTSILRGIAALFVPNEVLDGNEQLRQSIIFGAAVTEGVFQRHQALFNQLPSRFKIAVYGAGRFLVEETVKKDFRKTASLFIDDARLLSIEDVLLKNKKRFEVIKNKLISIMPNIGKIEREENENGFPEILFYEKDSAGNIFQTPVTADKLGLGYRNIFAMMGDMLIRFTDNFQQNIDDISGIVLIDEFDAHLHPKYQYELPLLLAKAFPKVQFIVSTHSPIPLLGLPKTVNTVIYKVDKTIEKGITAQRIDDEIAVWRLNPNALLTSPIFGFQQLYAPTLPDEEKEENEPLPIENFSELTDLQGIRNRLQLLKQQGKI